MPLWLAGATITVRKQDSGFILVVPASSEAPTYESVTPPVREYLQILNGIGRLLNPS
jgi:hypothetical protein